VTELLDLGQLAPILEDFCSAVGVSSAITDLKGSILVCARWERICGEFHRANQQTCARCFASDAELAAKLREDKPYVIWQCKNGLVEAAAPITIQGTHVATAFVGQFLLDQPDRESFRTRAREFGFDEADYLRALDEVPVVSSEKLGAILGFLSGFTRLVVHLSLERLKVLDAKSSCELSVADSEQAREELLRRRAQLETLVEERTEKLRQSEEHSRLILQAVAEGIIETDISGLCTFFNDAALKMLGYGVEELIGRSLHELFHHSNADGSPHLREQCPIYLAYSQGITSFRRDEVFWRKDGSFFDISYTSVPQRKGDDIIGAIVVFRDITNRKKTEDALLESETRLKSILATANEGFWWIDNDLRTVEVNDMMCNLLGRRREEILGRTPYEFLDEENMAIMKEEIKRRIKGETSVYEIAVIRPDGSKVYSLFHATPLFDKNKVKTGAFALVTDITPHKKMAEELIIARNKAEAATRAKSDFLANMSHEIRTPMNAVLGMTHLALKTELTPKQKDYLTKIQISANSLLGVINDILDFSKIEAGKLSMESIGFNLDEVLDNLATQITIKAQEKEGLEVLFSTDADVPRSLVGDPLRLSQILLNLANNAIKFTEHGEIVVSAELVSLEKKRAAIQFSVRDTGIGLSPEHMARLFSSFSQADNSITRKYGGSGLGLAICQRLVEMMGGKIWVESTPGVGSTFFFTAVFGTDRHAEKLRHVLPPELRGIRALVVDDNPTSQEIFQTMLESFSFQVTLTATGEEAVQEIERSIEDEAYDIVIMDWKLPGMDGIEAAKRIKRNPRLTEIPPIVLVSAYGREEIMWRAEMAGLEAFLLKPISPSVMFDTIMSVLAKDAFKDSDLIDQKKADSRDIKSLQGARVLLVEDNEINQQVAMEMLVAEGVVVSLAKNGREALEAVNADRYDVVLMDIQMPVMDGYTATRIIRADPRFKDLPIIAMTAHAMAGDQEKSLDAGMNDHINKPVDPVQLYTVLEKWISGVACPIHPESTSPAIPSEPVAEPVAIADPAAAPEPPFPTSLEGFNLADGMRRLRGNKTLYRKLLLNFGSQYTHKTDEIRQALNEADYPAAHQLVHDVKGLAGSLAASHLQAAAAELEKLVKTADKQNPPPAQALADALTDLQVTMDQALCSAQSLAPEPMAQSPAPLPGSTPILPPELAAEAAQRLREAAEMGDVSGLGAIVEEMVTRSADFTPYRDKITQLADDFDFDGIVALAGELADSENV
jgi:PAS domain S-box-containing protein